MTPRSLAYGLLLALLFTTPRSASAQLELSEPSSDSSADVASARKPREDAPTSSRLRKLPLPKEDATARPSDKAASEDIESSSASENEESPTAPSASKTRTAGVRSADELKKIVLIDEDQVPPSFFSSAVPRTAAIGEDSTLHDVCHVGLNCWAVGDRGVVCFSTDGGETWVTRFTPRDCSLRSVCFLTNKVGWIAGLRILPGTDQESAVLMHTRDGGITWLDMTSLNAESVSSEALVTSALPGILHIQYFGLRDAVAVTLPVQRRHNAGVFRSNDGGQTWTEISADKADSSWTTAKFLSASEGVVVGSNQSYAAVVSDQTVVINPPQATLRQMRGVSLNSDGSGWIVGDGATILNTRNSGVTWESPTEAIPRHISELNDLHTVAHQNSVVVLAGNPAGLVLRSSDAGEHWKTHTIPAVGQIQRLRFLSDDIVIAVGSLGQIVRSTDAGISWYSVRSNGLRCGILNLVTDANRASWQLLANGTADFGVRSVTLQMSQPFHMLAADARIRNSVTSERSQFAMAMLGGSDSVSDWMFPRSKPEQHRAADKLISEWTRQTDGQLRRLLPLRLARDLRNWKPTMVVIEPTSDDDAVASIMRDVALRAVELAASDENGADVLSSIGLPPWTVERVVYRVESSQQAALSFDDSDLLTSLGTTTGLLCDASTGVFSADDDSLADLRTRSSYEVLMDLNQAVTVQQLFEGFNEQSFSGARRSRTVRSREEVDSLRKVLSSAHIEGTALQANVKLARPEEAFVAELQSVGRDLPEALAAKQLRDLASLSLQQNNMEGYMAVLQEITRRYPNTEDGREAASTLFLFYSSSEARYYRLRSSSGSKFGMAAMLNATPSTMQNEEASAGNIMTPEFRKPVSPAFSSGSTDPVSALQERWDMQAMTALRILSAVPMQGGVPHELSPSVQLRNAANQRLKDRSGEFSNALSELSQRDDMFGVFARSEMQLNAAALPAVPIFNLPRRDEKPFLDGKLTDSIWENAEELSLRAFDRSNSVDETIGSSVASSDSGEPGTFSMVAWDEEFLYFAARMERSAQQSNAIQLATHRSYDAKHENRDRFEIEIDTDRDFITSFQLCVDESGLTSDRCWMLNRWNPQWYVAVDSDESAWRVEAAIPFSELAQKPAKPGDIWSLKIRRIQPGVLQHELVGPGAKVSTQGTALVRFVRPKVMTGSRQ